MLETDADILDRGKINTNVLYIMDRIQQVWTDGSKSLDGLDWQGSKTATQSQQDILSKVETYFVHNSYIYNVLNAQL